MKLFDRMKLLVRSTFGSLLHGSPADDRSAATPIRRSDRSLDKARAHLEILQQDLAGAERRGDKELADRLRREIGELQRLLDKAQARRQAVQVAGPSPGPSSAAQEGAETHEAMTKSDAPGRAPDETLDDTRIADQIRKARERE
ncbi:MAG: hypothetical protein K6U78_15455 [Anaerolineae bacterium]|nr:hypothetical protein [Anaerolineae bacterium]